MISGVSDWQSGAAGLVILGIIALFAGWIVPRPQVNQLIDALRDNLKFKDDQLAAKDKELELWKEAARTSEKARDEALAYSHELIQVTQTNTKVLHALTAGADQGEAHEIAQVQAPSAG
jgi:hypothetical protein